MFQKISSRNSLVSDFKLSNSLISSACLVILSSIFIALFAQLKIFLPFTPVPLVVQDCVVLMLAVFLGPRQSMMVVGLFLLQGACGLPVFATGGGLERFFEPTGGYLVGYFFAALVVGYLIERAKHLSAIRLLFILAFGHGVVFFFGVSWLSLLIGLKRAFFMGFVPFIAGNALKLVVSAKIIGWVGASSESRSIESSHK